jgi:putative colanic acid biosynthesis glycosyltransferase
MKIMYINVTYKQGSHGNMVSMLHQEMSKQGHDSFVLYGRGKKSIDHHVYKIASNIEIKLHALLTRLTGFHGFFSPFSTFKAKKLIRKIKPDIIHLHELHAYYINMDTIIKFINKKKIKTHFTFHSEMMYTGKCGFSFDCNKFEDTCHHCPLVKEYPKSILLDQVKPMHAWRKKAFDGFDTLHVISPSKWLINKYKRSFLKDVPITHKNNGIDETKFVKTYARPHKKKYILAVANKIDLDPRKGFHDIKILASRLLKHDIDVLVIGAVLKHTLLPPNMHVMKRTESQEELASYYQHAHVFVILSQIENQPLTVIEALISGTKVIGYDVGGIQEMAVDPYLKTVPYGKILDIERLILSSDGIQSTEIQKYAFQRYSKEIFLKEHIALYMK